MALNDTLLPESSSVRAHILRISVGQLEAFKMGGRYCGVPIGPPLSLAPSHSLTQHYLPACQASADSACTVKAREVLPWPSPNSRTCGARDTPKPPCTAPSSCPPTAAPSASSSPRRRWRRCVASRESGAAISR